MFNVEVKCIGNENTKKFKNFLQLLAFIVFEQFDMWKAKFALENKVKLVTYDSNRGSEKHLCFYQVVSNTCFSHWEANTVSPRYKPTLVSLKNDKVYQMSRDGLLAQNTYR